MVAPPGLGPAAATAPATRMLNAIIAIGTEPTTSVKLPVFLEGIFPVFRFIVCRGDSVSWAPGSM